MYSLWIWWKVLHRLYYQYDNILCHSDMRLREILMLFIRVFRHFWLGNFKKKKGIIKLWFTLFYFCSSQNVDNYTRFEVPNHLQDYMETQPRRPQSTLDWYVLATMIILNATMNLSQQSVITKECMIMVIRILHSLYLNCMLHHI
jgi:hypothetical protein